MPREIRTFTQFKELILKKKHLDITSDILNKGYFLHIPEIGNASGTVEFIEPSNLYPLIKIICDSNISIRITTTSLGINAMLRFDGLDRKVQIANTFSYQNMKKYVFETQMEVNLRQMKENLHKTS